MKKISMEIVNYNAAGIDIGSKSHLVSVGQDPTTDVREYGVYTSDHERLVLWLKERSIKTIAMESTGSYWQTLFTALQCAGFEVLLVNGKQIKNVKGKTDVMDCMWIQKLHSLGLLTGSYLPSEQIHRLRTLNRHRIWLVEEESKLTNKMQKSLRLMNIRLDVAINDIMGKSGRAIIEAILNGERKGTILAQLVSPRVKKTKEEIIKSLQGHWDSELLYELADCYNLYNYILKRINECDVKIEIIMKEITASCKKPQGLTLSKKQKGKNHIGFDLITLSYYYYGIDLFAIEGVSFNTIMTLISEIGTDIVKFRTYKKFVKWLRLSPNNKITGGKIVSSRTPKGKNILALALRNAANTIERQKKGQLYSFFKRIAYKKGRGAAITATARKLAIIIWKMCVHKEEYKPMDEIVYNEKIRYQVIKNIQNKIKRMNLSVNDIINNGAFC
jgi:transposase